MIPLLYQGSVKDLLGPVRFGQSDGVVFEYSDAYSVFDWGRMPDPLPGKGQALAVLAAELFERLESPGSWSELARSPEARAFREANRFGAELLAAGDRLAKEGLRTHYLGLLPESGSQEPVRAAEASAPTRRMAVRRVTAVRPAEATLLGRAVPDYSATRAAPAPRLVPVEVVFRFGCPAGSSLLERVRGQPGYLAERGYADLEAVGPEGPRVVEGVRWDFPVIELFSKLEPVDRPLSLSEALAISGIDGAAMRELLHGTAWVAVWLKALAARAGIALFDGKVEWGAGADGGVFLVDAIGPDELRLEKDGARLSKEFLRSQYRGTAWHADVARAKAEADARGSLDWKAGVREAPGKLPPAVRELASQLYPALANALTGRAWFPAAWPMEKVVAGIRDASGGKA